MAGWRRQGAEVRVGCRGGDANGSGARRWQGELESCRGKEANHGGEGGVRRRGGEGERRSERPLQSLQTLPFYYDLNSTGAVADLRNSFSGGGPKIRARIFVLLGRAHLAHRRSC